MIHIILIVASFLHPFFVSVTDINQNAKSKTLEISSKIFCDDLEMAILKESNKKINIINPQDKVLAKKLITNYITKHIQLKLNGKPCNLHFVGYENIEDAIWVYLEIDKIQHIQTFEIKNDILLNLHPEQVNIINLKTDLMDKHFKADSQQITFKFQAH